VSCQVSFERPRLNLGTGRNTDKILSRLGGTGTHSVAVKCVDIMRNTKGEGRYLGSH